MAKDQSEQVRDDNLRLLLSAQEAGYIHGRLRDARAGLRMNALVGGIGLLVGFWFASGVDNAFWTGDAEGENMFTGIAAIVSTVIGVYGLVCAAGAGLTLRRYKSYETDHAKFLKHYRRQL